MGYFESFIGVNFWTALFVLLNTLTIFFVARKFLFKPVMKIITERQREIDGMYTKAGEAREQAKALREEYADKLSAAAETSDRLVKEAIARGQVREAEIIRQAKAEADAIISKANADIAQEKKKAMGEVKDEISVIAMAVATKVVGRALNETDQASLVDSFIDQLGDGV